MKKLLILSLTTVMLAGMGCTPKRDQVKLLVFSKTMGYRHQSIPVGKLALMEIAQQKGWAIDTTEDAAAFTEENLAQYSTVIFLSTTGDVLDIKQQRDFERYIQSGGGYIGIHAAADTEYDWPWYGRLAGAYFTSHPNDPNILEGKMDIVNQNHPSTAFFGQKVWTRSDEFYNFKKIYHGEEDGIIPLIQIDETSYEGGTNGDFHPMSWYHDYDGGRAFYTNFGHTDETFSEENFIKHLTGGLEYTIGDNKPNDYTKAKSERYPDESRFVVTVLDAGLDEPEELAIMNDGRILFIQRRGKVLLHDPAVGETKQVGNLSVFHRRENGSNVEEGLVGLALDPQYDQNHWIYLYYAPAGEEDKFNLSRFVFQDDSVHMSSEKLIMEVPIQRRECCHTGGSIQFASNDIMFLSTGDNTNPFETNYAPINELDDQYPWDAQKSSGNMEDLRGKILRIKINTDATYDIPEGNLFPKDGSEGRPEIYVMGCRNPYRISIDSKTGFVYWGDVGPDARIDSSRGPRGYDEVNQARVPGFFGWPYFVGNNYPYSEVNFATGEIGEPFDPARPVNNSPNNTGKQVLPPVQPAFIYYPYVTSPEFPILGSGGRNAMAGPVFHQSDFSSDAATFPAYYEDKLFIYDFMRDWVFAVNMNEDGDLDLIEPFLSDKLILSSPMDMEFGPDGAMYMLEYGTRWFAKNNDARLIKIEYQAGNRTPIARIDLDDTYGAAPFEVVFSAADSKDPDNGDQLSYAWDFGDGSTGTGEAATHNYVDPGTYTASLTVTDDKGSSQEKTVDIHVGNAPPAISLELAGNKTFFWKENPLDYTVKISDQEDGEVGAGIATAAVAASFEFLNQTEDKVLAALGHEEATARSLAAYGEELIANSGCIACHGIDEKIVGPAYRDVAKKYASRGDAREYLVGKILNGGSGVWGGAAMAAQEQLDENQAMAMAAFILTLADGEATVQFPLDGTLAFDQHSDAGDGSSYLFSVSYQDQGTADSDPIRRDMTLKFRSPNIDAATANLARSSKVEVVRSGGLRVKDGDHTSYGMMDMSGLSQLNIKYRSSRGVVVHVHADSPEGEELGSVTVPATGNGKHEILLEMSSLQGFHELYLTFEHPEGNNGEESIFHFRSLEWMSPR